MKYCKGEFSNATSATLGVDFYMKSLSIDNTKDVQLQLWDTCGQERFRSIAKSYFRRADGVVLMYDVTCEQSFLNVREWIQSINDNSDKRATGTTTSTERFFFSIVVSLTKFYSN